MTPSNRGIDKSNGGLEREYIEGFNKAKETYKFTEENMTEFAQYVLDNISYNNDKLEEMLSTWKEQQIKTIYYE